MKKGLNLFALGGIAVFLLALPAHAEEDIAGAAASIAGSIANGVAAIDVARTQASANKDVAITNANAEVTKTKIMADVQSDANIKAAEAEIYRTQTAAQIAAINQNGLTERQAMISTESIIATKEKYAAQREQAWMDYGFNMARLRQNDRQHEEQLALEKHYRDLQTAMGILAATGDTGGLQITKVAQTNLATNATNTGYLESGGNDPAQTIAANSAQNRLTRTVGQNTLSQKISSFRGAKSVVRSTDAPQLTLAANFVRQSTPMVRGSSTAQLLTIANDSGATGNLIAGAFTSQRAARGGAGHGHIGRQADSSGLADGPSALASNESSNNGPSHHRPQ